MKWGLWISALLLVAWPNQQALKPAAPEGWSIQTTATGWVFKPDDLREGKVFSVVMTKAEKAQGTLREYLDGIWAGLGEGAKRNERVEEQAIGDWQSLFSFGTTSQGDLTLALTLTVFRKGELQFSSMTLADSAETHQKYAGAAGQIMGTMLGANPAKNSDSPAQSSGTPTTFEVAFPAGWKTGQQGPMRFARQDDAFDPRRFKSLVVMPSEPIQGSLEQAYERFWNREMGSGFIQLRNPGIISPDRGPQPLRRRMKNGLIVLWEGGEGTMGDYNIYAQLFMVCGNASATPVLAVFGTGTGSILDRERAPVMQFLESFRPNAPVPKTALFSEKDVAGKWQLELNGAMSGWYTSSGGYLGDASTGGLENLDLRSDGTYSKLLVAKAPQLAWTHKESGTWKVVDDKLLLRPENGKPQTLRIYGRAVLHGELNVCMGLDDDARIPTDALEAGCQTEMLVRGSCLFKYKARPD